MQLVLGPWESMLREKLLTATKFKLISPSMSMLTIEIINEFDLLDKTEFVTRFSLYDFFVKLSDLKALKLAVSKGTKVFGLKNLHSKVYIFGDQEALISSANFTYGGVCRNHECGILVKEPVIVQEILNYFNRLKSAQESPLALETCDLWEEKLTHIKGEILTPYMFEDYGVTYNEEQ